MAQVKLLFDCIAMLLEKQPLDFDVEKSMCIKLLKELKSLEKNHKQILAIQKWMFETEMTKKYLADDTKKTDNILIYCKEPLISQEIKYMNLQLQNKEAMIESKNKLLNILTTIELNQKLLQRKFKEEVEQSQTKLVEVRKALHSSSNVYSQLHTKNITNNIKIDELIAHMESVEIQFENRVAVFRLNIKQLNKSITEISKETIKNFLSNNEKNEYIIRKPNNNLISSECNLLNSYNKQMNTINDYINKMDEFKLSKIISQNESQKNINWTDFLMTNNFANETFILDINRNYSSVTDVNTLLDKLNDIGQTLNSSIKDIVFNIDGVQNKRNATIIILKKLNENLDILKQNNSSMAISNRKNNDLKIQYTKAISDLENKIQKSNNRLSTVINNKEKLYYDLQRSDLFFKETYQNYMIEINSGVLLLEDETLSKGICLLENIKTLKNTHAALIQKQTKIILDQFNAKKSSMETFIRKKSKDIDEKRNIIMSYKNKKNTYKQLTIQLKDLNTYTENYNNGLLKIYHDLVLNNHSKSLKRFEEEEIMFQRSINLYKKELDELNEENTRIIENHLKLMNIKSQIENCNESLQQITSANESLKTEINKNNIH